MSQSKTKRNIIALIVAVPVIIVLSQFFSFFDTDDNFWDAAVHIHGPHRETSLTLLENLHGKWKFRKGDELAWAGREFDDSSWSEIGVPDFWEGGNNTDYDGFAWYRRHFDLDESDLQKALILQLGRVDDVDEVYINGKRIGGTGTFPPTYITAYDKFRSYTIPQSVLEVGDNLIAVRVFDAQMGGGIYSGEVGIYTSNMPPFIVNLEGEWQFKIDKDGDFSSITVPGNWENQGYNYDGMAWYQKQFGRANVSAEEKLILLLGKIDDTDEVKLNGELIGRTGTLSKKDHEVDPDYYRINRRYEFPASLLKENNVLEVRVHDSTGEGGIYAGPVGIVGKKAYLTAINAED